MAEDSDPLIRCVDLSRDVDLTLYGNVCFPDVGPCKDPFLRAAGFAAIIGPFFDHPVPVLDRPKVVGRSTLVLLEGFLECVKAIQRLSGTVNIKDIVDA